MKRKFKIRKRLNKKIVIYILLLIVAALFFNYTKTNIKMDQNTQNIINMAIKYSNNYSYNGIENKSIINNIYKYVRENVFNSPINLIKTEFNYDLDKKEEIKFMYSQSKDPVVYIYNSHQRESYSTKYLEEYNIVPDVLMVSRMLKEKLENINIKTIVEENDITLYMKENNLDHAGSYIASRNFLTKAIINYPNAKLFIDLHRDAAPHDTYTTEIDGKMCAKVLFVIGLENENYVENLETTNNINNIILEKYPSLTRGIMKKQGYGVNGVYNQDLASNIILLEMGSHENNIEEVNNTLDLIAQVIGEYLNEKK